MRLIAYLRCCLMAYRMAGRTGNSGIGYTAVLDHGVPEITILIGTGREAWRLSNIATEAITTRP